MNERRPNKLKNLATHFTLTGFIICVALSITLMALAFCLSSNMLVVIAIVLLFLGEPGSYFIGSFIYYFADRKEK